jgi:hypothetical protein
MESHLLSNLFLAFTVGGVWVALSTAIADKMGTKIGGLIAGLPSTVVVTLFFVGVVQGPVAATEAAATVPVAYAINGPFLVFFCLLIRRGLLLAVISGLLTWIILSFTIVKLAPIGLWVSVCIWITTMVVTYWLLEAWIKVTSHTKAKRAPTFKEILIRAFLSGGIVTLGTVCSKFGGPVFGGLFASFPAVFLSALIIAALSGGADFSRGLAKSMMLSGFVNVGSFAITGYFFFTRLGLWLGTFTGLGVSLVTGYLTLLVIRARMS